MKKIFLFGSICLLILFAVLSKYEDRPALRSLDFAVTTILQGKIDTSSHLRFTDFIGNIMEGATFFASPEFTVMVTLFFSAYFIYDRKSKRWNWKACAIPLALTAIVLLEIYAKSMVHHPSPPFSMIKNPTTMFDKNYINEQFSYPSGHAARAIFMALLSFVAVYWTNGLKRVVRYGLLVAFMCYVLLVSVSRIYLGHHWFSDVLGGLLLGTSFGFFITWMLAPWLPISQKHD
ncbi:phosphatase PAP2 family protein [Candidatus Woesebacteria bacterium]|jgi:undecaprenyl-diphosphatase|nr:phosphatase PAP2 family protein [Candidatus Woesebacteria bacterium]